MISQQPATTPSKSQPETGPTALDPSIERAVRQSFAKQGAMAAMGAEMCDLGPGACRLRLPFGQACANQHGTFHGGVIAALADSAGGYAALTLLPPGEEVLAVEFKINFLAPALGDELVARGKVLRPGGRLFVCQVDVEVAEAGTASVCALLQQTVVRVKRPGSDEPEPPAETVSD